jgi:hypothetical protein
MSLLGTAGTISLVIFFFVLAKLSERFGSVVRMSPLYRYYYLSLFLALISTTVQVLAVRAETVTTIPVWITAPWFLLLAYHLPLAIAVSIGIYVTWHYWSWLITERSE